MIRFTEGWSYSVRSCVCTLTINLQKSGSICSKKGSAVSFCVLNNVCMISETCYTKNKVVVQVMIIYFSGIYILGELAMGIDN